MSISLAVLILVFLGIALRQVFRIPMRIWQMMGVGACIVLLTKQISLVDAWMAVDWSLIFFLFGMFYVGQALEESGYLNDLASRYLTKGCSKKMLAFVIVFGMGIASAIMMNDTLAILGTPLLLRVASRRKIAAHPLLMGLAFAITIGSVMSPIGNPQNLFIALRVPVESPFVTFLKYLAIPTLLNLGILYFFMIYFMRREEGEVLKSFPREPYHKRLIIFCKIALGMIVLMIGYNIMASFLKIFSIPLPWIALIPAFYLIFFGPKRKAIFADLDWHTLIFFVGLFILMQSVWNTTPIKDILLQPDVGSIPGILSIGALASQVISNVPLVALYLPIIKETSHEIFPFMALAAGSTIAGNVLIFGAASNMIITQNAEKRGDKGISFFEFAKYGILLACINLVIYWAYLSFLKSII